MTEKDFFLLLHITVCKGFRHITFLGGFILSKKSKCTAVTTEKPKAKITVGHAKKWGKCKAQHRQLQH